MKYNFTILLFLFSSASALAGQITLPPGASYSSGNDTITCSTVPSGPVTSPVITAPVATDLNFPSCLAAWRITRNMWTGGDTVNTWQIAACQKPDFAACMVGVMTLPQVMQCQTLLP